MLVFVAQNLCAENLPTELRFRYSGSAVFTAPTAYCRSVTAYLNDNTKSYGFISQNLGDLLEVSVLRPLSDENKGKNIINGKLTLMSEGMALPAISLGLADVNAQSGEERIGFVSASKNFETFGLSIHAGIYRDPVDKKKIPYYAVEKIVFPLLRLAVERIDEIDTYGIRLSPYPGVSLDIAQRDGKEEIFNLVYSRSY